MILLASEYIYEITSLIYDTIADGDGLITESETHKIFSNISSGITFLWIRKWSLQYWSCYKIRNRKLAVKVRWQVFLLVCTALLVC